MKTQAIKVAITGLLIFLILNFVFSGKTINQLGDRIFAENSLEQVSMEKPRYLYSIDGIGKSRLKEPVNITVNRKGYQIIADKGNAQLKVYDEEGKFVRNIGARGYNQGEFSYPYGLVTTSEGDIWVSDPDNRTVQQFDIKGNLIRVIISSVEGIKPGLMTIDPLDKVYISDLSAKRILIYNKAGEKESEIVGNFSFPQGITVINDNQLWVGDAGKVSSLKVFSPEGLLINQIADDDKERNYFKALRGLTKDSKNRLYVSDPMANKVLVFTSKGKYLFSFGARGNSDSQFNSPTGIFVDQKDQIYIADRFNQRVQVWGY